MMVTAWVNEHPPTLAKTFSCMDPWGLVTDMKMGHHGSADAVAPLWFQLRERRATADDVLSKFQITEPPVDVRSIIQQLGIHLSDVSDPGWSGAVMSRDATSSSQARADIWVNAQDELVRQRFTLAHELGHLLLHPLGQQFRDTTFFGTPKETQANAFAANLLMPLWLLSEEAAKMHGNARALADRFAVSEQAMSIRMSFL